MREKRKKLLESVNGKCLTEAKRKEFKELIREEIHHPVFGSHPL